MSTQSDSPRAGWRERFLAAKSVGAAALDGLREGERVFVSSGCAEPTLLVDELIARHRASSLPRCEIYMMFGGSSGRLHELTGGPARVITITATPETVGDYFPWTIHQTARLLHGGELTFDVALVHTSTPDDDGFASLGVSVDFATEAVAGARVVVAEVNAAMPRTRGDNFVDTARFDGVIEIDRPLLDRPSPKSSDASRRVAELVAARIPDGATIECGVGRVMADILRALHGHSDLGLHTGLFIDEMVDLVEAGAITNSRKSERTGVSVANQARGTSRTYEFLDDNPSVHLMPAWYTHDAQVLAALPAFHAINSALQVDLVGRVNSEFRGSRRVSSTGGLGDFVRAACGRADGRSIIALNATDGRGNPRIVNQLADAASVTLTADLADLVVTEFGVADLRGRLPAERAEAMIAIAAPEHRDALTASLAC